MKKIHHSSGRDRTRLHERITAQVRELISSGELKPGDRLPPERKLAELFHVSRNSVREAIRTLQDKQILISRPGSGTFVADLDKEDMLRAMSEAFERQQTNLEEILELRQILEPGVARLAAQRISNSSLASLEKLIDRQEAALDADADEVTRMDLLFHQTLIDATGNTTLASVLDTIGEKIRDTRSETLQNEARARRSIEAHRKILTALKKRDGDLAAREMEDHLSTLRSIIDALQ